MLTKPRPIIADLLLIVATLCWGASFIPIKILLEEIPPYELLFIRFGLCGLVLIPYLIWRIYFYPEQYSGSPLEPKPFHYPPVIGAGLVLGLFLFAGYAFQTVGMQYTSATNAAFVTGLNVVFVPIFLVLLRYEKPRGILWFCVLISLTGLALLSLNSIWRIQYGDFLIFFCAITFALHVIYTTRFTKRYDPIFMAGIQFLFVFIAGMIISVFIEKPDWVTPTFYQWILIGFLALFATGFALLIQAWFQRYTETTRAALIYVLEPVFAAIFSFIILSDRLSIRQWLGALLILTAMILSELRVNNRAGGK